MQRVVSLTLRRLADPAEVIAGLRADQRPMPNVNAYDELLAKRAGQHAASVPSTINKESVS